MRESIPLRNYVVRGLAGATALEGMPLTSEQGDRLLAAAVAATRTQPSTRPDDVAANMNWDALDVRAREILSPQQYTLFTTGEIQSGFSSRWMMMFHAAVRRAHEADAAAAKAGPRS